MIISLEEARDLLGDDSKSLNDEELEKLIDNLDSLARAYIQAVLRGEMKMTSKPSTSSHVQ